MKFKLVTVAAIAAGVVVLFIHLCGLLADKIAFLPRPDTYPGLRDVEMLTLEGGGSIAFRYTPPPVPGGAVFLHCHGNSENLGSIAWRQELFRQHGYGFAAFDYEGYGRSSGKPSEAAVERDVLRVWRHLTETLRIPPQNIVIHGFSLGTGAACFLGSRVKTAKALILEAPFTSIYAVAGMQWLPGDRFRSGARIGKMNFPVMIVHGDRDGIIPFRHGKKLFEKAPSPKRFFHVRGAGHNDLVAVAGEAYWKELGTFLK